MTGYTRKTIGHQRYVFVTVVGSGRVKVAFDGGPDIAMWDETESDPWVLKFDGFEVFHRSGDMPRMHAALLEFSRERRRSISRGSGQPVTAIAAVRKAPGTKAVAKGSPDRTTSAPSQSGGLVFRPAPHDTYLVFTTLERAERIDSYRTALKAKTWGEFRKKIGQSVYQRLFKDQFDDDNPEPKGWEPFEATSVPGFEEGDFPPWIVTEMEHHVPMEILMKFGVSRDSALNGSYWHIDSAKREEVLKALKAAGISAVERPDLSFW